ncbi:MAG: hypothetical protein A2253_05165 [Deltaproteobacteria bacterium RIFOXYA2_FULL_55_11]|nr:MAG: hypothetical protein A2253_05165 [Deltaproteobacteria bacterium RIFOXYA2_FULL_55_11]
MALERFVILNPSVVTLSKAKSLRTRSVKASAVRSAERISGKMTHYQEGGQSCKNGGGSLIKTD